MLGKIISMFPQISLFDSQIHIGGEDGYFIELRENIDIIKSRLIANFMGDCSDKL